MRIPFFRRSDTLSHVGRWTFYFVIIGVIAGLGSICFHYLCQLGIHFFMDGMAGFRPPAPAGEHHLLTPTATPFRPWVLFLLPALGGILSGVLVYTFAPEAEGHGTDAAIDAYHNKGGFIRGRVPIIKTIASTITLATGGSGGREGPIAQIGAGFGSFLATRLGLSDRDRRIMMAAGVGAGVGAIFRAPLAGALFAAEVLYRDPEFESDVIIPAGISSVVSYCIFCLAFGWGSLFEAPAYDITNPLALAPFIVLAFVVVIFGAFYVRSFYGVTRLFEQLPVPNQIKPMIGGLFTGAIGLYFPYTLAFGYGWIQNILTTDALITGTGYWFLLTLTVGKILTTSFSIGSGGSGGVFGPSVVIGGALGGLVGKAFHELLPGIVAEPGAFVIVGMAGFFTAVSNTPISTIIFVSEMTDSYHLLMPSLLVCAVAYLLSGRFTIFENQVKSKLESGAHAGEFFVDILQAIRVRDLEHLIKEVRLIPETMSFREFKTFFAETKQHYFPVMNEEHRLSGIFSSTDIRSVLFSEGLGHLVLMKDIATTSIIVTHPGEDLNTVLKKFTIRNIDSLPVVRTDDSGILVGMLNRREVIGFYNEKVQQMRGRLSG
ncbi:MAG: chloride channel protein [Desulfobacterales bacterium]|nr:MAG: chloride channel protein [Desulfobacterales bacterium]